MLKKRFDDDMYEIIEFDTDEQVFENILKFGVKTVPFVVHNNLIYKGTDLFRFVAGGMKNLETFKPIEVITY